jgi:hypothetical protein
MYGTVEQSRAALAALTPAWKETEIETGYRGKVRVIDMGTFKSVGAFVGYVESINELMPSDAATYSSHKEGASARWDDNVGFHGAAAVVRDSWKACADAMQRAIAAQGNTRQNMGPSMRIGFAGQRPNVALAAAGAAKHMWKRTDDRTVQLGQRPIVYVTMSLMRPAACNLEVTKNYAAALLGAIDAVESTGKRVELALEQRTAPLCDFRIIVKKAGDAWNTRSVAAAMHPAMSRRLGFRVMEASSLHPALGFTDWSSVGSRCYRESYGMGYMKEATPGHVRLQYLDPMQRARTLEHAQACMVERFAEAGVTIDFPNSKKPEGPGDVSEW